MFNAIPLTLAQEDLMPAGVTPGGSPSTSTSSGAGESGTLVPGEGAAPADRPQQSPGMGNGFFFVMIGMIFLLFIFSMRSQSKEKKRRAAILASLGKGDRIETIGGILGTIVELRDNEVVVKVDENNNTRIKFARAAIKGKVDEKADGI